MTGNPPVSRHVNKIENIITFKVTTRYYIEVLTPETKKLLGSTNNKTTKNKNVGNGSHLEITEIVLVHWNVVNNDCKQNSRILHIFLLDRLFGQLLEISPENF